MWFRVVVVVLLCIPAGVLASPADTPGIETVCPNPIRDGDRGELVVVRISHGNWTLKDGETRVSISATANESVAMSPDPEMASETYDMSVQFGEFKLANSGEQLALERNGRVVDTVRYRAAAPGECLHRTDTGYEWLPVGASDFPVQTTASANVTAFVLPDQPGVIMDAITGAEDRVLLAGYTFSSRPVAEALVAAANRGVTVEVLLEGEPVGGFTSRSVRILDGLTAAGVNVTILAGPKRRYSLHHAKYAVVDDDALVLTENWKPSGVGGHSNRGWGVLLREPETAHQLAALFTEDASSRGTSPWTQFRRGLTTTTLPSANGTFRAGFEPATVQVDAVDLLVTPDNAEPALVSMLESANDSILVEQVAIGGRDTPFLASALDAARRGVTVKILLSGAWYAREDNQALVDNLNAVAERESLPLTAKVVEPSGFEKIHAKGVIVDDTVVLGSMNWNVYSSRENREVVVALHGQAVAAYYRSVFSADWGGVAWDVPVGLPAAALLVGVAAALRIGKA